MKKIPVIAIVGPTASGKTSLSVEIAKRFSGEIVCADSMQIYKGMMVASAVPTNEEKQGIPHHLFEFLSPLRRFTVADYVNVAKPIIKDIYSRGKIPVVVGGTGLYIDSLFKNITFTCESDTQADKIRVQLENEYDSGKAEQMLKRLEEIDPKTASRLHTNDKKRIIRALQVYLLHNKTMSQLNEESLREPSPFNVTYIGLRFSDRQKLYERINKRVDIMVRNGLIAEAESTFNLVKDSPYYNTAFQAIGHKELYPYFSSIDNLEDCIEKLKQSTRRYAKRQMTWFNRNKDINWIDCDLSDSVFDSAIEILKNKEF